MAYTNKSAKYASHCNNGHQIEVGDMIGVSASGTIVCVKCLTPKPKETLYSNKFCGVCFLELPLNGVCGNCE